MDVQKIPKRPPPFYIFRHYATYRKLQKKFEKKFGFFFSIFSFLRAFVVASSRKGGFRFRVFLSLRYGADLGRSRLVLCLLDFSELHQKEMAKLLLLVPTKKGFHISKTLC